MKKIIYYIDESSSIRENDMSFELVVTRKIQKAILAGRMNIGNSEYLNIQKKPGGWIKTIEKKFPIFYFLEDAQTYLNAQQVLLKKQMKAVKEHFLGTKLDRYYWHKWL